MISQLVRICTVILTGMIAGTLWCIWFGFNPKTLSLTSYLEQQQNLIKSFNVLMPALGLVAIIFTLITAFINKERKSVLFSLLVAAICLICSGLVTRFGNQPINAVVITWTPEHFPENWTDVRDKWWLLHIIRSVTSFVAFLLVVQSEIRK
ncbi:MAG TPA: DUF1772 domain-containing protein [Cyclobacteriaceae bacterium]|jgi:hypothetical protein|nr:DUF1772 domain-containing protein [Cyclobacteriaceae bacterium]